MGTGSFPEVKRSGRGVDHPSPSSTEVKERVQLYLYSPSGPSWPVIGRALPLPLEWIHWSTKTPELLCAWTVNKKSEPPQTILPVHHNKNTSTQLTKIKLQHAIPLVHLAIMFTQLTSVIRNSSQLPPVKLLNQNQTSLAVKWIKYHLVMEVLPVKAWSKLLQIISTLKLYSIRKGCCLKLITPSFCMGHQKQGI